MGYTSESLVEAYELRENQWPPPGKEIVDVDGTKFMRDKNFKEIINENSKNWKESFPALEKNIHQDVIQLQISLKNILVQICLIILIQFGKVVVIYAKRKQSPLLSKNQSSLNLWFFRIQNQQQYLKRVLLLQLLV